MVNLQYTVCIYMFQTLNMFQYTLNNFKYIAKKKLKNNNMLGNREQKTKLKKKKNYKWCLQMINIHR